MRHRPACSTELAVLPLDQQERAPSGRLRLASLCGLRGGIVGPAVQRHIARTLRIMRAAMHAPGAPPRPPAPVYSGPSREVPWQRRPPRVPRVSTTFAGKADVGRLQAVPCGGEGAQGACQHHCLWLALSRDAARMLPAWLPLPCRLVPAPTGAARPQAAPHAMVGPCCF